MNNRVELLAESLREAAIKAQEEQDQAAQVERIAAAVKAKLAHRLYAEAGDLQCPQCGYTGPEDSFDEVDDSEGYSTDPETSDTASDDNVEELDAAGKKRVVAELLRNHKRRR